MSRPLPRAAPWAAGALLCAGAFVAFLVGFGDTDTFHHLAYGREILRHGLSRQDPLLYPLAGQSTGPMPYWLASAAIYAAHALLGDPGPVLLAGLLGAALFAVLYIDALGDEPVDLPGLAIRLAPVLLALSALRTRAYPRPELFANLFLALTLLAIRRHVEGRSRALVFFPLLALVWANVHPSLPAGLAAIGLYGATGLAQLALSRLRGRPVPGAPSALRLAEAGAALLGGTLAAFSNPSPLNPIKLGVRFALSFVGLAEGAPPLPGVDDAMPFLRHLVNELKPMAWQDLRQPMYLSIAVAAVSFLAAWRRARLREAVTLAAFAAMAASAIRFGPLAAVVAAPIAARNLGPAASRLAAAARPTLRPLVIAGAAALLALGLASIPLNPYTREKGIGLSLGFGGGPKFVPVRAADYLKAIGFRGRLFDTFHFGGYLAWKLGIPVYQDGRGLLPAGEAEAAFAGPHNPGDFAPIDHKYRFDALVVGYPLTDDAPEAQTRMMARTRGDFVASPAEWALVAFDDGGLLYLRRDGPLAEAAAREAYRRFIPGIPLSVEQEVPAEALPEWIAEVERSVREAPRCLRCRVRLGRAYAAQGRAGDALGVLAAAEPVTALEKHFVLLARAGASSAAGDADAAKRLLRQVIALGVYPWAARRGLIDLDLRSGDLEEAEQLLRANLEGPAPAAQDYLLASLAAAQRGDVERTAAMQQTYRALVQRDAARRRAEDGLGFIQQGRTQEAIAAFEDSARLYEPEPMVQANLGFLYLDTGDPARAERAHRRAVALDPGMPDPHYGLALVLLGRGDRAGAAGELRAYLRLQPRGYWSLRAEEMLRAIGQ